MSSANPSIFENSSLSPSNGTNLQFMHGLAHQMVHNMCSDVAVVPGFLINPNTRSPLRYEKLEGKPFSVADAEYFVFHSPYNKLVQKSFARLVFNDFVTNASYMNETSKEKLAPFLSLTSNQSY